MSGPDTCVHGVPFGIICGTCERERPNVTPLNTITKLDIPVERVLDGAKAADLRHVIVVGTDKKGELRIYTSNPNAGVNNLLLDCAKVEIVNRNVVRRPMEPDTENGSRCSVSTLFTDGEPPGGR